MELINHKNDFTKMISSHLLTPLYMEVFQMYSNVRMPPPNRRMKSKYMLFQDALRQISKWTSNDIEQLYTRVVKQPKRFKGCMESLYYSHMNSFSSFYNTSSKVSVQIPTPRVFLHQVLLQIARFLYVEPKKITEGVNAFKPLVLDALDIVVMTSIPVDTFVDTKAQELKEHMIEAERMDMEARRLEEERKIEERIAAETQRLLEEQNKRTQDAMVQSPLPVSNNFDKESQISLADALKAPQINISNPQSQAGSINDVQSNDNDNIEIPEGQIEGAFTDGGIADNESQFGPIGAQENQDDNQNDIPLDKVSMLKAPVEDDVTSTMSDIPRNTQIPNHRLL